MLNRFDWIIREIFPSESSPQFPCLEFPEKSNQNMHKMMTILRFYRFIESIVLNNDTDGGISKVENVANILSRKMTEVLTDERE